MDSGYIQLTKHVQSARSRKQMTLSVPAVAWRRLREIPAKHFRLGVVCHFPTETRHREHVCCTLCVCVLHSVCVCVLHCVCALCSDAISQSDTANFCCRGEKTRCVFSRCAAFGCHFMTAMPFVVCHCASTPPPAATPPLPSPSFCPSSWPAQAGSLFSAALCVCAKLFGHWHRPIALKSNVKCRSHTPPSPLLHPSISPCLRLLVRNICRINFKF